MIATTRVQSLAALNCVCNSATDIWARDFLCAVVILRSEAAAVSVSTRVSSNALIDLLNFSLKKLLGYIPVALPTVYTRGEHYGTTIR